MTKRLSYFSKIMAVGCLAGFGTVALHADIGSKRTDATPIAVPSKQDDSLLTLERLYNSRDFRGEWFGGTSWLEGREGYTLIERQKGEKSGYNVVLYNPAKDSREVLISAEGLTPKDGEPLRVNSVTWSTNGRFALVYTNAKRVWRYNTQGDYWVKDLKTGRLWQLGANFGPSSLMFAKFSPDNSRVAYVQKTGQKVHDIYLEDLESGKQTRLTTDGSETIINGTFDWAYEEEFGLRDGFRWSPDGQSIAYWQLDSAGVKNFTLINNTDSLYPTLNTFPYPKVGEVNSAARIGVVSADGGETTWMQIKGDPRQYYQAYLTWAPDGENVLVQQLNRRQNTNQVWLAKPESGAAKIILTEKDAAWLDPIDDFVWLDGGAEFLWVSEQGGWRQLYRVSADGTSKTLITPGTYDVGQIVRIDTAGGFVYFHGSVEDPQRQYLYRVSLAGGQPEKLTPDAQRGHHSYNVSLDGKYAFNRWSTKDSPMQIEMVSLPDHAVVKSFVDNAKLKATYDKLQRGKTEFFQVTGDNNITFEGILRYPTNFDASQKYPVIFYVYGEPAGMTGQDRWSGRDLWNVMMTQKGYFVATVDNRGQPALKGRAWRKAIYRTLGLTNVDDQAAATKALLKDRPYLDADRIGIWGHSGGGTSTLHALFRHGDLYKVGVSRAPVPDLRLYDSIYQERYSGILPDDAAMYEKAVAINYASGLQGKLMLIHGTGDDNVHYQGSERLIDALVAADKQFDFFSYPNRTHGIWEGKNTTRHMHHMQMNYFLTHLPAGPLPQ